MRMHLHNLKHISQLTSVLLCVYNNKIRIPTSVNTLAQSFFSQHFRVMGVKQSTCCFVTSPPPASSPALSSAVAPASPPTPAPAPSPALSAASTPATSPLSPAPASSPALSLAPPGHRVPNTQFRVLIVGRSNAGKTSILQRVCETTESPEIYRFDPSGTREQVRAIPNAALNLMVYLG